MSKSSDTVHDKDTPLYSKLYYSSIKNKHKTVLKSTENIFKPKCNKELKNKLKKYKLRRDGKEDPDILDVSKILINSLRIKSPKNQDKIHCNNNIIEQELNQGNYIIRMVRKKKICTEAVSLVSFTDDKSNKEECVTSFAVEVEDKKQKDAFKFMMDSRNKSIGCNSPGKEKLEEQESEEAASQKELKAKRILSLQKMAQSKGSLKNKEIEELRDKCIKKKMIKRAERLKQMITQTDSGNELNITDSSIKKPILPNNDLKSKLGITDAFKLCDIYSENNTTKIFKESKKSNKIPKEDIDFMKKLSPSIKKKENMLSYFQKMPKEEHVEDNCLLQNDERVIKVKINRKHKKSIKKLRSTENIYTTPDTAETKNTSPSNELSNNNHKRFKRKRNLNIECHLPSLDNNMSTCTESRPKRNVKKPLKYTEDLQIFSSDEELHIFTPKKKKSNEKHLISKVVDTALPETLTDEKKGHNCVSSREAVLKISKKDKGKKINSLKNAVNHKGACNFVLKSSKPNNCNKAVKLAPIFVGKPQLSLANVEAKQRFLKSGVPDMLKKTVQIATNVKTFDMFPLVVHVQQTKPDVSLYQEKDWCTDLVETDEFTFMQNKNLFKNLLILDKTENTRSHNFLFDSRLKPENVLKSIKCSYPKFPVYRTFHLLTTKSKGEFKDCFYPDLDNSIEIMSGQCVDINNESPDQLYWCDKYKSTSSKQIIGNFEIIKELKKWLETWTENVCKVKQITSDSSDFSDFYHSDADSRDTYRNTNNVLILMGQTGSGKTSSVYAVASELAIKVIEVNSSSKRTGKIMLQDLQEATQSHKVDRGKSSSDNSQKHHDEIESTNINKRGRPKKANGKQRSHLKCKHSALKTTISQSQISASQESVRTGMSLILIDDADIVFEQDDGFCSAIAQLIHSSKRPVILVTSTLTCPHLQRFLQYGKILHFQPVVSRMLGTWLDVMCLADVGNCLIGLGAKVLDFYKGDIRKTINCLQFYMNSNKHLNQDNEVALSQFKHNVLDEDSSMSWLDFENSELPISNDIETDSHIHKQLEVLCVGYTLNIFNVWWNLPNHYTDYSDTEENENKCISTKVHQKKKDHNVTERLDSIAHALDTISLIDYFDHNDPGLDTNISTRPWHASENASLLENENFECYNKASWDAKELSNVLIKSTIAKAQSIFKNNDSMYFSSPSNSDQRKRDKIVSHHNKLSTYLLPSAVLDRRATALDYWPSCRTICRIEKSKSDLNAKRKNRFCHYLKSLNILSKNDFFDSLADSLTV